MAYNPNYYTPYLNPTPPINPYLSQPSNGMTWVQGEAGAKSYLLAPDSVVPLWDTESQTIYLKSTDKSGIPVMKILDYTIREVQPIQNGVTNTVSRKDFDDLAQQIAELKSQIESLTHELGGK